MGETVDKVVDKKNAPINGAESAGWVVIKHTQNIQDTGEGILGHMVQASKNGMC